MPSTRLLNSPVAASFAFVPRFVPNSVTLEMTFFSQFQTKAERFKNFGVRIGAGGEIAVGILLFGYDGNIVDTDVLQNTGNGNQTGAV